MRIVLDVPEAKFVMDCVAACFDSRKVTITMAEGQDLGTLKISDADYRETIRILKARLEKFESKGLVVEIMYDGHGRAMLFHPSGDQFTVADDLPTEARLTHIEEEEC